MASSRRRHEHARADRYESAQQNHGSSRVGAFELFLLENTLRKFVTERMAAKFGPYWRKHRVPDNIYKQWDEKCKAAIATGEHPEPLEAYADLDDWRAITTRRDKWDGVFALFSAAKTGLKNPSGVFMGRVVRSPTCERSARTNFSLC